MSIDARVTYVSTRENDNGGTLHLEDRDRQSPRGQPALHFADAPLEVTALNGLEVWGGADTLYLGNVKIADRVSVTRIRFVDRGPFLAAVGAYHESRRATH